MTHYFPLTLLYDSACPVCNLEMDNLKARNTAQQLKFVDISTPLFDPAPYGATLAAMNGLIHAQRPDGSLVVGVEVFRLAYGAVGLGHVTAPTGWPLLKPVFDAAYAVFARNRYRVSAVLGPVIERLRHLRATQRATQCATLQITHATHAADIEAAAYTAASAASACHNGQCNTSSPQKRSTP
jgi:predicted DCC family thiol-disulfide oxidoreductase YuxK